MPAKDDNPLRYILRLDYEKTGMRGWKFIIKRKNKFNHKYFIDSSYGGKRKALQSALIYREKYLKKFDIDDYRMWYCNLKSTRNTSGIVGVGRYFHRNKNGDKKFNWQAFWRDADGKRMIRTFPVSVHGEVVAKELACQAREEGMAETAKVLAARKRALIKQWKEESKNYVQVKAERKPCGKSGMFGVSGRIISRRDDSQYVRWVGCWTDVDGNKKTRSFSQDEYGKKKAQLLAYEAREAGLKEAERLRKKRKKTG
jgi:hypothetical protein